MKNKSYNHLFHKSKRDIQILLALAKYYAECLMNALKLDMISLNFNHMLMTMIC